MLKALKLNYFIGLSVNEWYECTTGWWTLIGDSFHIIPISFSVLIVINGEELVIYFVLVMNENNKAASMLEQKPNNFYH